MDVPQGPPYTVRLANLKYEIVEADIEDAFNDCRIKDIRLVRYKDTGMATSKESAVKASPLWECESERLILGCVYMCVFFQESSRDALWNFTIAIL